jgi:hypothetical protein
MGDCFEGWEGDFCFWFKPSGLSSFSCIEEGEGLFRGLGAGVGGVGPARGMWCKEWPAWGVAHANPNQPLLSWCGISKVDNLAFVIFPLSLSTYFLYG